MSETTITILILVAVVAIFIWNRLPAAVVAVAAALALFLTGILNVREALGDLAIRSSSSSPRYLRSEPVSRRRGSGPGPARF